MEAEKQGVDPGVRLHGRLLAGDVTAPAEIAELYLPTLVRNLRQRYASIYDTHLIETAVHDALINYFHRPDQYDPEKTTLERYLSMSSRFDLLNLIDKNKPKSNIVELDAKKSEYLVEKPEELSVEDRVFILSSPIWDRLREIAPDPIDQELIMLMMENVRSTEVFAAVLGIEELPQEEQAKIVKRHKDRLKKRIQRNISRAELLNDES